jgi:hypothetical protein
LSFQIPLESAPSVKVLDRTQSSAPPECPGNASEPTAAPGWLCVYAAKSYYGDNLDQATPPYPWVSAPGAGDTRGASRYGAVISASGSGSAPYWYYSSQGTWAVTAP